MKALVKWNGRRFDSWYWVLGIGYWLLVIIMKTGRISTFCYSLLFWAKARIYYLLSNPDLKVRVIHNVQIYTVRIIVIGYWFFLNNRISINACLPAGRIFEVRLD